MSHYNALPLIFLSLLPRTIDTATYAPTRSALYDTLLQGTPRVVVVKSDYALYVYDDEGWYATIPAVFGSSDLSDKMMEGDRKTPEGKFKIIAKKIHPEWGPFLLIDYPNRESREKFEERKRKGLLPAGAKMGGGIGIHGTRRNEDRFVDYYYNWTLGCIAVKREDAKALYQLLPMGTTVEIRH